MFDSRRLTIDLPGGRRIGASVPDSAPMDVVRAEILRCNEAIIRGDYEPAVDFDGTYHPTIRAALRVRGRIAKWFRIHWRATIARRRVEREIAELRSAVNAA